MTPYVTQEFSQCEKRSWRGFSLLLQQKSFIFTGFGVFLIDINRLAVADHSKIQLNLFYKTLFFILSHNSLKTSPKKPAKYQQHFHSNQGIVLNLLSLAPNFNQCTYNCFESSQDPSFPCLVSLDNAFVFSFAVAPRVKN